MIRKAWRARLRSPKLQLLGTLLGLSSRLWSALGERRTLWACGDPFPLAATPRGLEKTRSFKLTFWLLPRGPTGGRTHTERQRERSPWQERSPHRPLAAHAYSWVGRRVLHQLGRWGALASRLVPRRPPEPWPPCPGETPSPAPPAGLPSAPCPGACRGEVCGRPLGPSQAPGATRKKGLDRGQHGLLHPRPGRIWGPTGRACSASRLGREATGRGSPAGPSASPSLRLPVTVKVERHPPGGSRETGALWSGCRGGPGARRPRAPSHWTVSTVEGQGPCSHPATGRSRALHCPGACDAPTPGPAGSLLPQKLPSPADPSAPPGLPRVSRLHRPHQDPRPGQVPRTAQT